jgi:hypothetical protein
VEHPFDGSLTANTCSWNDSREGEHLYEKPDEVGEVAMAAVPSTIRPATYRPRIEAAGRRLRVATDEQPANAGHGPSRRALSDHSAARRRLSTFAAVLGLAGLWFGTGALASSGAPAKARLAVVPGAVYVVRAGDSVGSIARSLAPEREVPALVRSLREELHGNPLRPGMVLRVP